MSEHEQSPWSQDPGETIFLLDVATEIEIAILENWIDSTAPPGRRQSAHVVTVDLRDEGSIPPRALQRLLDDGVGGDGSLRVVPLRVSWSSGDDERTGPRLRDLVMGDPRTPNPVTARAIVARHPERLRKLVAREATVVDLWGRFDETHPSDADREVESFGDYVLRLAGIALDVAERQLSGRRYKVPRHVARSVMHRPSFRRAIDEAAAQTSQTMAQLRDEARDYLAEMAAEPTPFFIDWAGKVTRWIIALGYGEVVTDPANVERTRKIVRDHPCAFLFTHKSHVDGMAVISVLYENDFPSPHQIGGINMDLLGVGAMARKGGTVFIRRTFGDNVVYKLTLQQYLGYLLEKRFPLSWAFEGTRSRSGKLMPPRFGILKYVVDAADATQTEGLRLVPVAINYDLIGEVDEYARQEAGKPKEPESLSWFVRYVRGLRAPMGRIYLDFGEPLVVDTGHASADRADLPSLMAGVARRVNDLVPVTLPALMCTALLGSAPRALTLAELDGELRALMAWLDHRDIRMAVSFDPEDHERLEQLATLTFERGLIERHDGPWDTLFSIGDDQHAAASYYRNTIIHYFVDKAIIEIALVLVAEQEDDDRTDAFWEQVRWLRDLLDHEFVWAGDDEFLEGIETELTEVDPDWSTALGGSRAQVDELLDAMKPLVARATLRPYLEAYWIVADRFARLAADETLAEKDCTNEALEAGEQAFRRGRLTTRASIGTQMFKGAYETLAERGLVEVEDPDVVRRRGELATALRERLDHLTEFVDQRRERGADTVIRTTP